MQALIPILTSVFVAITLALLSGTQSKAAQEKDRARRLQDAEMNARLLRFNL